MSKVDFFGKMNNMLAQNKDDVHNLGSDDLLSQLPKEILVSILSSFPLKDAAVTSLLSRRWRYLWCQRDRLVFDDMKRWGLIQNELDLCYSNAEREKYMSWVNHIIHQHKIPTIDEFKICFGLGKNDKSAINKWIKFAISKNVRMLELDLFGHNSTRNYCFPNKIFGMECGSLLERQSFSVSVKARKFLKSLILKNVDVDDEGLKKILSNCRVLEHLSIMGSYKLVNPVIHGKGLLLKTLDMSSCIGVESVEIHDSNIVSFSCQGSPISTLRLDNLPKLEKICIRFRSSWEKINDIFCQIACCVRSLQVLHLDLYCLQGSTEVLSFCEVPQLKQLIIKGGIQDDDCLNVLISLVEAFPNLERLKIQTIRCFKAEKMNRVRQMAKEPYQCLEVVEIVGYEGGTSDLELATYFTQNCVALKKLVIDPFFINDAGCCVQELEPRTPVGVELVIL